MQTVKNNYTSSVHWDHSDQQGQLVSCTAVAAELGLSRNTFSFEVQGHVVNLRLNPKRGRRKLSLGFLLPQGRGWRQTRHLALRPAAEAVSVGDYSGSA